MPQMRSPFTRAAAVMVPVLLAIPAQADVVNLATNALPTSQPGWAWETTGNHSGVAENTYFSTNAGILTADSMGFSIGLTPGSALAVHDLSALPTGAGIVRADIRLRITESVVQQYNHGFAFSVALAGKRMGLGFSTAAIASTNQTLRSYDTTDWHTYTLIGDWGAGTYSAYIDDSFWFTESLPASSSKFITIGDATGTANARAEVSLFRVVVPAPSAAGLVAVAGLASLRRRR